MTKTNFQSEIKRINGYLKEVITFFDDSGQPISHVINPIMVELNPRDVMQIIVGAFLIATPLCFTEEVWTLSETLPNFKIGLLMITSMVTVSVFVYLNFYRHRIAGHIIEFFKRIFAIYFLSTLTVVLILYLIDKLPLATEPIIAAKRVIIIGFPALFGATISDYLK